MQLDANWRLNRTWLETTFPPRQMDPIPVRLPEDLQKRVDFIAQQMSISRSAVLRLAVRQWLDAAGVQEMNPIKRQMERKPGKKG
jgi:Arc/MetJ-type ribon-helix-helix transcriptional regulator